MKIMRTMMLALLAMGVASAASANTVDFESFTVNQSVNGQGQWTVEDSFGNSSELFDEEVIDIGGNNVWRISNATTSTSYSNQPFSQQAPLVAGETGAGLYNDYGTNHTMPNNPPLSSATAASPYFYGAWDFKSATDAGQTDLNIAISASAAQSTLRNSYIRITDSGSGGFEVDFFDTTGSSFNNTVLASGLSYDEWHSIEMYIEFVDGIGPGAAGSEAGNDILTVLIDGAVVHTGTTWESYFYNNSDGGIPAPSARAVDSLIFRQSGTAQPGNAGGGFYFDNVVVSNAVIPEPTTAILMMLGLMGLTSCSKPRR